MNALRDQTLALAGTAQFALYAHELATQGLDRRERIDRALHAILCTDPEDAASVFGGAPGAADGLRFLEEQLRGTDASDAVPVARYVGQVLRLSGRLLSDNRALTGLRAAIDRARLADPDEVPGILDAAYRENVSRLRPQIMVQGHPDYLHNPAIAQRLRTHLLAAVRCGVLWRQCGGRMWRLMFQRRRLLSALAGIRKDDAGA